MTDTRKSIDRHMTFQRAEWRIQKVGRWLMLLFVAAAIAGLFGGGPLATARAVSAGGALDVSYERLTRRGAMTRWTIEADVPGGQHEVSIRLGRQFADQFHLENVRPEPLRVEGSASDLIYVFMSPPGAHRVAVVFDVEPTSPGLNRMTVGSGAHVVLMSAFTYF